MEEIVQHKLKLGEKDLALKLRQIKRSVELGQGKKAKPLYMKLLESQQALVPTNVANEIFAMKKSAEQMVREAFGQKAETAGLEWGTHANIVETLLSNMSKQTESALKYLAMIRKNPQKFRPQLDNIRQVFRDMKGISARGLKTVDSLEKSLFDK